jgi:tripartite-type tricarboxylate transporter receptor subunit TctC
MKKLLLIILTAFGISVHADNVRLVVPFTQGGSADQMSRTIQKHLVQDLHKIVVVEYRPGASSEIGTAIVANSDPKELVLLLNGPGIIITSLTKDRLSYSESNLIPLVHLGHVPFVLVTSKKSGIKTFRDLQNIDSHRSITYGSSGTATATHLAVASLQQQLGKNFVHVPYKGSGQAIPDLISGNIDMLMIHWNAVDQFIKTDQITALVVDSNSRIIQLPKIPTLKEFGISNSGRHGYLVLFSNATSNHMLQKQVQQSVLNMVNNTNSNNPYLELGFIKEKDPTAVQDYFKTEKQRYSRILKQVDLN